MWVITVCITSKKLLVENELRHISKLRHEINILGFVREEKFDINFPFER